MKEVYRVGVLIVAMCAVIIFVASTIPDVEGAGGCKYIYRDVGNVTQCRWACIDEFGAYYGQVIDRGLGDRSECPESR